MAGHENALLAEVRDLVIERVRIRADLFDALFALDELTEQIDGKLAELHAQGLTSKGGDL